MKILPIDTYKAFQPNKITKNHYDVNSNNISTHNILSDKNYNQLLIKKTNTVSFGNNIKNTKENSLQTKIGTALNFADRTGDIIIAGKDIVSASKDLMDCIDDIPKIISRVLFIEDDSLKGSFLISNDSDDFPYIQNLSDSPITQIIDNSQIMFLKNSYVYVCDDSRYELDSNDVSFEIKANDKNTREDFDKQGLKLYNLDYIDNEKISEINAKRIKSLIPEDETKNNLSHKITFKDVGGQDNVIQELKESVIFPIKYPEAFNVVNHGIIMSGEPGTGKTLIAQALANETNAYFRKINGLEMESKWVGESEANWRNLFEDAKSNQPAIIFIDEFDAVAKSRKGSDTSRYDDKVVNQILTLMSDIEKDNDQIFVIAATNKDNLLDSAIQRSGRFGKHIQVPSPNLEGCKQILNIHTRNKILSKDFDSDKFAKKLNSINATGADIAAISADAQNFAYKRTGIFKQMDEGTFNPADKTYKTIIPEDFDNSIEAFKNQKKKAGYSQIGFISNNL